MMTSFTKTPTIRVVYLLNMLPIIGLMAFYYTRYIEGTYSFVIPLGLTFVWMLLSLMSGKVKGLLLNRISVWWLVYYFLYVLMVIVGFSSTNLNFVISRTPLYLIPAMGYFVIKHYNRKEKIILIAAFFVVFLANLGYNIFLGLQFPNIFEEQASTEESISFGILMNVADTFFIEICYMLIGAMVMTALVIKQKVWRIMCLMFVMTMAYYMLFQNTRGTAILLLIVELIGIILAYFEPTRQGNKRPYYLFSGAMLFILALVVFIPLMSWLMEHLQSERLAERLNDLVDFRTSGGNINSVDEGSFTARILLARTSLNTFFSSPISILIGIGDHTQSFGGDLIKSGIGNHSEFIDVLARFGLIGAFVFWKIMGCYYKMLKMLSSHRKVLKYVNVLFWIIVLSGILNLLFVPIMLLFMYIVLPLIIELAAQQLILIKSNKS